MGVVLYHRWCVSLETWEHELESVDSTTSDHIGRYKRHCFTPDFNAVLGSDLIRACHTGKSGDQRLRRQKQKQKDCGGWDNEKGSFGAQRMRRKYTECEDRCQKAHAGEGICRSYQQQQGNAERTTGAQRRPPFEGEIAGPCGVPIHDRKWQRHCHEGGEVIAAVESSVCSRGAVAVKLQNAEGGFEGGHDNQRQDHYP